jgi:hypothetical protein
MNFSSSLAYYLRESPLSPCEMKREGEGAFINDVCFLDLNRFETIDLMLGLLENH